MALHAFGTTYMYGEDIDGTPIKREDNIPG